MSNSIAIVGDRFMLPSVFAERIAAACGNGVNIRTLEQPWPDEPMEHGYAGSTLDGPTTLYLPTRRLTGARPP